MNSVSVIGLGKLGLPLAACLANKEIRVIGVDLNQNVIKTVNEGKSPYYEPGLAELVKTGHHNLTATSDYNKAIINTDITFIVVPTPSLEDGSFSTKYVEAAVAQIASVLKNKPGYHAVILTSTVLPGDTEGTVKDILENVSEKVCGTDFGLCYSPEFIALGSVIKDFTNPDVILIGESDSRAGNMLENIYRSVCQNNPPVVRTSIQNAELAKISLNTFVTMKITFANTLAEIAEKISGGDVDAISQLLGSDTRIGRKYLNGGLAYGGPCFPRDNKAFYSLARRLGCQAKLSVATDEVNQEQVNRIMKIINRQLGQVKGKNIAILGLTYKSDTDVLDESASLKIAFKLLEKGANITVYDPAALDNAKLILTGSNIRFADSAKDCLKDADFSILATPWKEFKSLEPDDFLITMKQPILLDCWRVLNRNKFSARMKYLAIGLNPGD